MTGGNRGRLVDERFALLEELGRGGMGTVWRARDTALHREVALKEVRPSTAELTPQDAEAPEDSADEGARMLRERVLREARALARLNHPNVVTVHHIIDTPGEPPWLVMELLPGETLQDRVAEGPLAPEEAARVGRQVLAALTTAHRAGIHHRDVKPGNVLLRADGSAVLTDFGIAALQDSPSLTATGEFLGSPEYVAPERIRGTDAPEGDLWSLGITLYVCTEGTSPLRRANTLATLAAVLDDPLPAPERSGALAPVLEALLVRDPAARPDAERLDALLAEVADGRTPTTAGTRTPAPSAPPPSSPPTEAPTANAPAPPPTPTLGAFGPPHAHSTPQAPPPAPRRRRTGLVAAGVAAGIVAAALLAGGGYLLATLGEDDRAAPAPTTSRTLPDDPHPEGSAGETAAPSPATSPATSDEATAPGPSPSAANGESTSPTTRNPKPPADGSAGARHMNSWVAQLASVPKSAGVAERTRHQAALERQTDGVVWVDSDDFAALRSGYWMLYRPGPTRGDAGFASGRAAAEWCARSGLNTSNQCVGRYLSDEPADRVYVCSPDNSRGTGRCSRE